MKKLMVTVFIVSLLSISAFAEQTSTDDCASNLTGAERVEGCVDGKCPGSGDKTEVKEAAGATEEGATPPAQTP